MKAKANEYFNFFIYRKMGSRRARVAHSPTDLRLSQRVVVTGQKEAKHFFYSCFLYISH